MNRLEYIEDIENIYASDKKQVREYAKNILTKAIKDMFDDVIVNEEWRNRFKGFDDAPISGAQGWYNLVDKDIHIAYDTIMFENVFTFYYLMVHEYTHLINDEFGVEDVEFDGYHNLDFKKSIKNLFNVSVSIDGQYGYQLFDVSQSAFYSEFAKWFEPKRNLWEEIRTIFYRYIKEEPKPQEQDLAKQYEDFEDDVENDKVKPIDHEELSDDRKKKYDGQEEGDEEKAKVKKKDVKVYEEEGGVDLV